MRVRRILAGLGIAVVIVSACGGGGGGSVTKPVDPVSGVAAAFDIANAGGTLKKMALANCLISGSSSSLANTMIGSFGSISQSSLNAAGVTTSDFENAWKVSFSDLSTKEVSRSGGNATVHVAVKISSEIDLAKYREMTKKAQGKGTGVVPDDATIDASIKKQFGDQLSQSVTVNKDISVSLQNDNWVACGAAFAYPGHT
jgi:hypothetical protein